MILLVLWLYGVKSTLVPRFEEELSLVQLIALLDQWQSVVSLSSLLGHLLLVTYSVLVLEVDHNLF